jgi:hypothetical protein
VEGSREKPKKEGTMNPKRKCLMSFWIYVPKNSGLADELGYWSWHEIPREEIFKYQDMGFDVLMRRC